MSSITFGPPGHEWSYTPSTSTYDLSPTSSAPKLTMSTSSGPPSTTFQIIPSKTALVIVDMQNFFLSPECMAHPNGLAAVQPTIDVIAKCRDVGIQVIWLNWGLTDTDLSTLPAGVARGFMKDVLHPSPSSSSSIRSYTGLGSDLGPSKGRCLFRGTWNADIYAPLKEHAKKEEDKFVSKNRMSGIWNAEQELYQVLREGGWENLLFTGVNTDQCVLGTLVDAYNLGWNCVCVEDCVGTTTVGGREVSLHNIANSYGFVTDSKAITAAK